jgi:hypothetical protein
MNKIDLIIDALEGMCGDRCNTEYNLCQASVALAAARELKALKPVAWIGDANYVEGQFVEGRVRRVWWECNTGVGQPLYTTPPRKELAKPEQEFYPDWDMIKPFHERIAELEEQLAKPKRWFQQFGDAPPRKEWVGLTDEQLSETYNDLYTQYTRDDVNIADFILIARAIETKLKELNT